MVTRTIPSTCTECTVQCGSLIHMEGDQLVKISGNRSHPSSRGAFCVKGMNAPLASRTNPNRITYPMGRIGERGQGKWRRLSWAEALDQIAERFGEIKVKHGATAIAGAAATFNYSRGTAVRLLMRSLGSPNLLINQDMCHGARATAALLSGFGGVPGNELSKAQVILVVGKSPSESDIVEWTNIRAAKSNGARLLVIDPRRTHLARLADRWLAVKPGTDAALALAMIHVILSENLHDRKFVETWCTGTDELRERARNYPPDVAARITAIPAEEIIETARLFASRRPGAMLLGHGIDAQENGVMTAVAFQSLIALTGNVDRQGSNRFVKQVPGFRGHNYFCNERRFRLPAAIEDKIIGGAQFPLWCSSGTYAQVSHNPSVLNAIRTGDPYPVRAMYVSGTNVVCTYPDQQNTIQALNALDTLVVASDVMTPTAELADFFLPKTTALEEEDLFMGRSEPCITIAQQIFPPQGEAKTDVEIAISLRDKLMEHGLIEFDVFPWASHREFNDYVLEDTKLTIDDLREAGFRSIDYGYEDYKKTGFRTPSGKFEFNPSKLKSYGYDPLPDYKIPSFSAAAKEFDLVLLTGVRSMAYHHSRFRDHSWARRIKNVPEITINPSTAARLKISKDDWVWVETHNHLPRALLKAKLSDTVTENVVATGMGWWYPEMPGSSHGASLFSVGIAVSYGPPFDPICGSPAEARNTACRLVPADRADVAAMLEGAELPLTD